MITSRTNARVRALAALRDAAGRRAQGLFVAEGVHLCGEALRDGASVRMLVICPEGARRPGADAIVADARTRGIEVLELSDDCFARISDVRSPEGIAAICATEPQAPDALFGADARLVALCGVQDPGNAGAIVRVAEAAAASGCIFLGGVDVYHPRFVRATMGSCFRVPVVSIDTESFLVAARGAGIRVLATVLDGAVDAMAADYAAPLVICLGAEGGGLPPEILSAAAQRIRIPMSGRVESLNVAVAAGVILYAARRSWTQR